MKLYLDNCCFNRPYDDQTQFKVSMETRAKLHIQEEIRTGVHDMIDSYMLQFENEANPHRMQRRTIQAFRDEFSSAYVPIERREQISDEIDKLLALGVHYKDATHAACALYAGCDCLLTTDERFIRRCQGYKLMVLNPVQFIQIEESEVLE